MTDLPNKRARVGPGGPSGPSRPLASRDGDESDEVASDGHSPGSDDDLALRIQNRLLPAANVARILKRALPEHAKISREAKECIQQCASEFISFVSSEAADLCLDDNRKVLSVEDILVALHRLDFDNYFELGKLYLCWCRKQAQLLDLGDAAVSDDALRSTARLALLLRGT